MTRPMTFGSAPNSVRQKPSVRIVTGGPSSRISPSRKSRPSAGFTSSVEKKLGVTREGLDTSCRALPIQIVRVRSLSAVRAVVGLTARLTKMKELAGIAIRQRMQEGRINDRENGGVGADAESKRQHNYQGEARAVPQRPHGIAQVLPECVQHLTSECKQNSWASS